LSRNTAGTAVVKAYEQGDISVRKGATRFDVSKAFVQKILKQKQTTGQVQPKKVSRNRSYMAFSCQPIAS
jgi:transposase